MVCCGLRSCFVKPVCLLFAKFSNFALSFIGHTRRSFVRASRSCLTNEGRASLPVDATELV